MTLAAAELVGAQYTAANGLLASTLEFVSGTPPLPVHTTLGAFDVPESADAITCVISALRGAPHDRTIEVSVSAIDAASGPVASRTIAVPFNAAVPVTLPLTPGERRSVILHVMAHCDAIATIDINDVHIEELGQLSH